jgi:hypothetical protein
MITLERLRKVLTVFPATAHSLQSTEGAERPRSVRLCKIVATRGHRLNSGSSMKL